MKSLNNLEIVVGTWLLITNWYMLVYGGDPTCGSRENDGTRLVINSHRNNSGHWVSQVELIKTEAETQRNSWNMDVNEHAFSCDARDESRNRTDGKSFTAISVTLVAPPADAPPPDDGLPEVRFGVKAILGRSRVLLLSATPLTWSQAQHACERRGLRLAHYTSSTARAMRRLLEASRAHSQAFVLAAVPATNVQTDPDTDPLWCKVLDAMAEHPRLFIRCTEKKLFFCQNSVQST